VFADSEIWSEGLVPHEEWATAVQGKRRVFLQIGPSDYSITTQVFEDRAKHSILAPRTEDELVPVSAIIINLPRLFARLRL